MRRILSVLLENESGALSRVVGLFSQRGYCIETLNVAPTDDHSLSDYLATTTGDDLKIEQITKHLNKIVDVVKVVDLTEGAHVERDTLLVKVRAVDAQRDEVKRRAEIFRGQIDSFLQALGETEVLGSYALVWPVWRRRNLRAIGSLPTLEAFQSESALSTRNGRKDQHKKGPTGLFSPGGSDSGAVTRLTIAITLIRMFIDGPRYPKGSPTVSPTTAAAWVSEPPPRLPFRVLRRYPAPPGYIIAIRTQPNRPPPTYRPARLHRAQNPRPRAPVQQSHRDHHRLAQRSSQYPQRAVSGSGANRPGISRNWRRISLIMSKSASPTRW